VTEILAPLANVLLTSDNPPWAFTKSLQSYIPSPSRLMESDAISSKKMASQHAQDLQV